MPIYEYVCNQCGRRFEQLVWSSTDADEIVCPSCGESNARKVMSTFGVGRSAGAGSALGSACPAAAPGCNTGGG